MTNVFNPSNVFLHNSKSFGLRFWFFFTFITSTFPSLIGFQLNALFYLNQTKSLFIPTFSHRMSTLYSSFESLWQKQLDCTMLHKKFYTYFCTDAFIGNLHIFCLSRIHIQVLKFNISFLQIWFSCVKGFARMYNLLQFAQ